MIKRLPLLVFLSIFMQEVNAQWPQRELTVTGTIYYESLAIIPRDMQ